MPPHPLQSNAYSATSRGRLSSNYAPLLAGRQLITTTALSAKLHKTTRTLLQQLLPAASLHCRCNVLGPERHHRWAVAAAITEDEDAAYLLKSGRQHKVFRVYLDER